MKNKPFAKKSLGQNFLVDDSAIDRIVAALDLLKDDTVIEIGPGRGALTRHLIEQAGRVIAIELDRELVPMLREQFRDSENFSITEADALEVNFRSLRSAPPDESSDPSDTRSKLVANLPYYISTAILQHLIEQLDAFSLMVLMFQKEVVDRITAKPGDSERGYLTVMVEAYLEAEKLFDAPPTAFRPQPKVQSSVVKLVPRKSVAGEVRLSPGAEESLRTLVSAAFAQKRKTILNNLKHGYPNSAVFLKAADIDPTRRAESLTIAEWFRLEGEASKGSIST